MNSRFLKVVLIGAMLVGLCAAGNNSACADPETSTPAVQQPATQQPAAPATQQPAAVPAEKTPDSPAAAPPAAASPSASEKKDSLKAELVLSALEASLLKQRAELAQLRAHQGSLDEAAALQSRIALIELQIKLHQKQAELAQLTAGDQANGVYKFFDEVTETSVRKAIDELDVLSRLRPKQPITIVLNSPGGSVYDGLALYDHLRALSAKGHHITVVVRGMAASMGSILLQAGDTRVVGPESEVLIHEVSSASWGKINVMLDDAANTRHLWEKLSKILARRSKITVTDPNNPNIVIAQPTLDQKAEAIRKKAFKFDWWLDAEEAVRLGFADEIE